MIMGDITWWKKHNNKEILDIYSGGVGEDLSFSEDVHRKYSADIYAFDPTPRALDYVEAHYLNKCDNFHFFPWGLSAIDGIRCLHMPVNREHVSGSCILHEAVKEEGINVSFKRVKTIMRDLGHDNIDILKLDIEGMEFEVINDMLNEGIEFSQLLVEVHDRFFEDRLTKIKDFVRVLESKDYALVNISKSKEELVFLKN